MSKTKTHEYQSALAHYCKTGDLKEIPGINKRHIHHYRRLVVNNVYDSISSAYPLTMNLLGDELFKNVFDDFFKTEPLQHPQIWMMPKAFMEYIHHKRKDLLKEYIVLEQLLEFEWLEIEVYMMADISLPKTNKQKVYILNPEIRLMKLDFPIHLKQANRITPNEMADYFVGLHRHPQSGNVHFTNLSVPFVDLLEHCSAQPLTIDELQNVLSKYGSTDIINEVLPPFLKTSLESGLLFFKE